MLLTTLIAMVTSFAATLVLSASPLLLGTWIMLIALTMALTLAISSSSWLSLMMFLIYIGGLLVMFAYFVALTPNLFIEGKIMLSSTLMTFIIIMMTMFSHSPPQVKTFSFLTQAPMSNLMLENMFAIITMALTLFFALVAVVKLCSSISAPLRPFN